MNEPTTPLMQQYHAVKKQHPSALLLFRLGDFYELFYDDAVVASRLLQITLTARNKEKGQAVPMCGVPYHAAENYIARLIRAGHKVAICEQVEVPGPGKKIVRREVVRVLTPGTASGAGLLGAKENNYLAAVARSAAAGFAAGAGAQGGPRSGGRGAEPVIGLAFVDLSTGEFRATEFSGEKAEARLRDELGILRPREVLLARAVPLFGVTTPAEMGGLGARLLRGWILRPEIALAEIEDRLNAVGELKSRTVEREEIHRTLEGVLDLERLTSRITLGVATPRDLLALRQSLEKIPSLRTLLAPLVTAERDSAEAGQTAAAKFT